MINYCHIFVLAIEVCYSCCELIFNYGNECKSEKLVCRTEPDNVVDGNMNFFSYIN